MKLLTVDSTNNYAMGLIRAAMAQHGAAVFAQEQTRGKGQRSRSWASQTDQNIALSMILEPSALDPQLPFLLSMTAALSALDLFRSFVPDEVSIKWPNDLYWRDRKAAGILIENLWQGPRWTFAVVGIGVNINQTDFGNLATRAVSLKQITGKTEEPEALAIQLCAFMEIRYQQLLRDPSSISKAYNDQLYKRGQTARFKRDSRVFEARIDGVNEQGQLLLYHGLPESVEVGSVEWLIA